MGNGGTWLEKELFTSKAFVKLGGCSPQVLIIFYGKRMFIKMKSNKSKKSHCTNNNHIAFTYKEAEVLGISKPKFTRAIDELLAKGFITIVHQGGAYKKDKTYFGLSEKWRLWNDGIVFETREGQDSKRGYQGKAPSMVIHVNTHENVP